MKISIIIPIYNKVRYLDQLWQDLLDQTFRDYECLLIDDGSTDGSAEACDAVCGRDDRFRVFHIPNQGVSHARNVGLDHAAGEYITFVDGDDRLHPEYLQNLYACMTDSGADLVIGSSMKVWADSTHTQLLCGPYHGLVGIEGIMPHFARDQMVNGIYGYCWNKLLSRELIGETRFNEGIKLAEDLEFYLSIYPRVRTIYFDDLPHYYYLQDAENSSVRIADRDIDYLAQLGINLHYRAFLREMEVYSGDNQRIVEQQLSNYLFFTAFYCKREDMDTVFPYLHEQMQKEKIACTGGRRQKKELALLAAGNYAGLKHRLLLSRALKHIIGRGN